MLLRSRKHSKKQPGCFFPSFDLPMLTLPMQGAVSICQARSVQWRAEQLIKAAANEHLSRAVSKKDWSPPGGLTRTDFP